MNYNFKIGDKIERVFINTLAKVATLSYVIDGKYKEYERTIRKDDNGEFFTWNKNKIYLNDWIRISLEDFNELVKERKVKSEDISQMLMTEGVENIIVYTPMFKRFSGNNYDELVKCYIDTTEYLRNPEDNYKLWLKPFNDDYGSHDMYVSDMVSFIKDKRIVFKRANNKKYSIKAIWSIEEDGYDVNRTLTFESTGETQEEAIVKLENNRANKGDLLIEVLYVEEIK